MMKTIVVSVFQKLSDNSIYANYMYKACTGWANKNVLLCFCMYLRQLLTDFQIFFLADSVDNLQSCHYYTSHYTVNASVHYFVTYE